METKYFVLLLAALSVMMAAAAQTSKQELLIGSWKLKSLQPAFPADKDYVDS